jgi:hypothetical protein
MKARKATGVDMIVKRRVEEEGGIQEKRMGE